MTQTVLLGDEIDLIGGGTPKTTTNEFWGGNIPWLSVVDFGGDARWVHSAEKTITELGLEKSSTKLLDPGDIIISARGTVGELAQLTQPMAFNQSCYGVRSRGSIDQNYLYYLLKHSISDLQRQAHGGVFSTITRETFRHIKVAPPDIKTQKKIVDILGTIDEKIELNRRINETLEQMGQALFRHYFIDNPEVWQWEGGLISDLVNIYSGYAFKRTDFDPDGDYGLVTIKNVQDGSFNPICTDFLSELPNKTPDYARLETGDILLSLTGNVGRVCIVYGEKLLLNQRVAKLEGIGGQSSYAYFLFRQDEFKNKLISMSRGTAQLNLSPVETKNIKISLPPSDALESFYSQAEPLMEKITENYQQIQTLTTLRDTLLPRLINGKVKV